MTPKLSAVQNLDRRVCVDFLTRAGLRPCEPFILGSYWTGENMSGLLHSTYDGEWVAIYWKIPIEIEQHVAA